MKLLGTVLVFGGYVLVYAAAAAGGKFATEPLAGLFADAYTGAAQPQDGQPSQPPPNPRPGRSGVPGFTG